jgi:hypothetical protein
LSRGSFIIGKQEQPNKIIIIIIKERKKERKLMKMRKCQKCSYFSLCFNDEDLFNTAFLDGRWFSSRENVSFINNGLKICLLFR